MFSSYLAVEGLALQRPDEVAVHLIGSQDDGGHRVLVLRRRGGQQGQRGQGDVVLAAGEVALVVAVRAEAAGEGRDGEETGGRGGGNQSESEDATTTVEFLTGSAVVGVVFAHLETSENASTHTAGQGTMRTTMRPSAVG